MCIGITVSFGAHALSAFRFPQLGSKVVGTVLASSVIMDYQLFVCCHGSVSQGFVEGFDYHLAFHVICYFPA